MLNVGCERMKDIDNSLSEVVKSRLAALRSLDLKTLRALPQYSSEVISIEDRTFSLGIYHELLDTGDDLIVVQCYNQKSKFLWMTAGTMHAQGFVVQTDENIRDAEEKLLWDYT